MTRPFDADPGRISPEGHFPSFKSEVLPRSHRRPDADEASDRLQIDSAIHKGCLSSETNDQFIAFRSTRRSSPAGRGCDLSYRTRLRPAVKGLATMCLWKQNLHIDDFLVRS